MKTPYVTILAAAVAANAFGDSLGNIGVVGKITNVTRRRDRG